VGGEMNSMWSTNEQGISDQMQIIYQLRIAKYK